MIIIITKYGCAFRNSFTPLYMYSIVKDSSADLGVNFNIVQNRPTVMADITLHFFFKFVSRTNCSNMY